MILIALHKSLTILNDEIEGLIQAAAESLGKLEIAYFHYENPFDLLERLSAPSKSIVDIALVPYDMPGITGIQVINDAYVKAPTLKTILFAQSEEYAAEAAAIGITGYQLIPINPRSFLQMMERLLSNVSDLHSESVVLNTRGRLQRVLFEKILYCETSGHDQIVHLDDGSSLSGRYSSQSLFELLGCDPRFFKAGSSYVLNIDHIRNLNTTMGLVTLDDGTAITVPSRLRKNLENALLNRSFS